VSGVGEKRLTIRRVVRIERDADARRDAVGLRRIACCAQRFQNGLGKRLAAAGFATPASERRTRRPQTRHHLTLVEHCGDARSHGLSTVSPVGVAEQVPLLP